MLTGWYDKTDLVTLLQKRHLGSSDRVRAVSCVEKGHMLGAITSPGRL